MPDSKPIIFSGPMVRAILNGNKSLTSRVDGLDEINADSDAWIVSRWFNDTDHDWVVFKAIRHTTLRGSPIAAGEEVHVRCPYTVGLELWVRENYRVGYTYNGVPPRRIPKGTSVWYEADDKVDTFMGVFRSAIFMMHWMSRIRLRVLDHDHRCQRLLDITEDEARAEGVRPFDPETVAYRNSCGDPRGPYELSFYETWDSLNGDRKGGLYHSSRNPWRWAVKFEVIK